jgi:hypothetical protein
VSGTASAFAYAKEAIRLAGVEAVARCDNASEWQSLIREQGREGQMAA